MTTGTRKANEVVVNVRFTLWGIRQISPSNLRARRLYSSTDLRKEEKLSAVC